MRALTRRTVAAGVVAGTLAAGAMAVAFWSAGGAGTAVASVGALAAPTGVTVPGTQAGSTVAVSWTTAPSPSGSTDGAYWVRRYVGSTASDACGSSLASPLPAGTSTCADTGLTNGSYKYSVTFLWRSWTAESAMSSSVVVTNDIAGPTLNIGFPAAGATYNAAGWNAGCASGICGTAADPGSGVANVKVSIRQGAGNYWDGTAFASAVEVLGPATGTTTWAYPFPAAALPADGPFTVRVVATDGAAPSNATAASRTFAYDNTAPTGGSISYTNGYAAATSVSIAVADGADAGSGVNATATQIQRSSAALSAGACGTFGSFANVGPVDPASPFLDPTLASGNCYRYQYLVPDTAGNTATYSSASITRVDTVAPANSLTLSGTATAFLNGTTLYYDSGAAGSLAIVDAVSDAASGPASATFPAIAASGWTHGAETVSTPAGGPYQSSAFTWSATPNNPTGYAVTGTDAAGRQASTSLTFVADNTAPASGSVAYTNGYVTSPSVAVTLVNGTDAGSGIKVSATQVQRQAATLSGGSCGSFGSFANVGPSGPSSPFADTTVTTGNCYRYRYLVPDNVGNTVTYTSSSVARVDTTPPVHVLTLGSSTAASMSGSTIFFKGNGAGSFTIDDDVTDTGSGPASVAFPAIGTTGWTHNNQTDTSGPPYTSTSFSWTANPSNPTGYSVTAADAAGNQSPAPLTFTSDVTAPAGGSVSYTDGYVTTTSVAVTVGDGTDAGSGVNAGGTLLQRATASLAGGTCGGFGGFTTRATNPASPFADSTTSGTCYKYQYVVADNVGNSVTYTSASVAKVDATVPTGSVTAPANNGFVTGSAVAVTSSSADVASGVLSAQFQTSPSGAGTWTNLGAADTASPYSVTWNTTSGFPNGAYDLRVVTTDNAGNVANSATVTVEVQNGAPAPTNVQLVSGGTTSGRIDQGDTIVVTYSQSLHVNSLCSAWPAAGDGADQSITGNSQVTVTVTDGGASNDSLTVSSSTCSFQFGTIALGSTGYATGGNLTFNGSSSGTKSTITWDQSARTLTILLGQKSGSGTQGTVTAAAATYTPDPDITSAVGTPITGTFTTANAKQF